MPGRRNVIAAVVIGIITALLTTLLLSHSRHGRRERSAMQAVEAMIDGNRSWEARMKAQEELFRQCLMGYTAPQSVIDHVTRSLREERAPMRKVSALTLMVIGPEAATGLPELRSTIDRETDVGTKKAMLDAIEVIEGRMQMPSEADY